MVGITSYGAYIPFLRLNRDLIANAWGKRSAGGERSVANHDEDSVTMAIEAAIDCLKGIDRQRIDGLYFASTTSPYNEKQCSTMIAATADLPGEVLSADFANSLRAGTSALRAAKDAVASGSAKNFLVTVADCRIGFPQSDQEQSFGDAGAALLIGDTDIIATIEDSYSICDEITDVWRTDKETFVHSWEDRWVLTYGHAQSMERAVSGIMKRNGLSAGDFAKVVLNAPNARAQSDIAKRLGFDTKTQVQDALFTTVGNTGAAHPLLMLVAALEEAKAGDKIILAGHGQGADAFILTVTDQIDKRRTGEKIKGLLESKAMVPSYARYLAHRQLLLPPPELFNLDAAATTLWRTRNWVYSCHGSKCNQCGMVTFPIQRVCYGCQSKDDYQEVRLSDKKGKVFTFSLDNLAGGPDTPLVQTILESEEGGARIYCLMTDCDPNEVKVDMPVEMTFRRLREARGFYSYFWKCRPLR